MEPEDASLCQMRLDYEVLVVRLFWIFLDRLCLQEADLETKRKSSNTALVHTYWFSPPQRMSIAGLTAFQRL